MSRSLRFRHIWQILCLSGLYYVFAWIGLTYSNINQFAALVWAPSGIALGALIVGGKRLWPGVFLGAFAINWTFGAGVPASVGIATGNTLEAIVGAMICRFDPAFGPTLVRVRDIGRLVFGAALGGTLISASFGVLSLWLAGKLSAEQLGTTWSQWWAGDTIGILTVAPVILTWPFFGKKRLFQADWNTLAGEVSFALFTILFTMVCFGVIGKASILGLARPFFLFPIILFAALRLSTFAVTLSALNIAVVTLLATASGIGPFANNTSLALLFHLPTFVGTLTLVGLVLSATVSEREAKRKLAEKNEAQLRTVANAIPISVVHFDRSLRVLYANDVAQQLFQQGDRDSAKESLAEFLGGEVFEQMRVEIKQAFEGEFVTFERKNGTGLVERTLRFDLVPETVGRGETVGCILVGSDVTLYKVIEGQLKAAKEAADSASRAKSAFLANMSHEIRTPLGVVLGFVDLTLNQNIASDERGRISEIIQRNGKLLSKIINDILDLSKVEAGKLEVEIADVPLLEVLEDIRTLLALEAEGRGIQLEVKTAPDVPSWIRTDSTRLRQILFNVIGNAVKFTSKGGVYVQVRVETSSASSEGTGAKHKIIFEIRDTGLGIREENISKLFSPFSQADFTTTREYGGTGLGLAISKRMAEELGGGLELKSTRYGEGSTFELTISAEVSKSAPIDTSKSTPLASVSELSKKSGMRVLVVEDVPDNQILIERLLRINGAEVSLAPNGKVGVDMALVGSYDLVLMDIQMPEMDGYQALAELRSRGFRSPVVALTAHAMESERKRCLAAGFDDHLSKPINRELLRDLLGKFAKTCAKVYVTAHVALAFGFNLFC